MADAPARQKIAVIGGGVGAMTTVFELTEQPGWADKYEITVYQMGWRLGGKGASGRNQAMGDRIEEHGVHFWFGYYENAFNLIQRVYAELGRRPDEPLATWRDAFKPHELFILMQFHAAQWSQWDLRPPRMPGVPGDGEIPTFWKLVDRLLEALHRHSDAVLPDAVREALHAPAQHPGWLRTLGERLLLGAEHFTGALGFHATREVVRRLVSTRTIKPRTMRSTMPWPRSGTSSNARRRCSITPRAHWSMTKPNRRRSCAACCRCSRWAITCSRAS